jgi:hypothetical protein
VAGREPWLDEEIKAVRHLLDEVSNYLSASRIEEANELLQNDEPELALLGIAWDLGPHRDELPEHVVRLIKEEAADSKGLHPAFRQ